MCTRKIFIAAIFSLSLPVAAQFTTIERAYEVPLSEFNAPVTRNGILNFKECADCEHQSARLTPLTAFVVAGQAVELRDFRAGVAAIRGRSDVSVLVMEHLESDTITSIEIP